MKLFLILAVVLFGIWLWRTNRETDPKRHRAQTRPEPKALEMVSCTLCSMHVPAAEAVKGKNGVYCTTDHLHLAEP